jgi:hypothetical protein
MACKSTCKSDTCTFMFIAALFTKDKVWEQPRFQLLMNVLFSHKEEWNYVVFQENGWDWRSSF